MVHDVVIFGQDQSFLDNLQDFICQRFPQVRVLHPADEFRLDKYLSYRLAAGIFFLEITPGKAVDCYQTIHKVKALKKGDLIILLTEREQDFINLTFEYKQASFSIIHKFKTGFFDEIAITLEAGRKLLFQKNLYFCDEDNDIISLPMAGIAYLESGRGKDRGYLLIHHESGIYKMRTSLKRMLDYLDKETFSRCHNSFIINHKYIIEVNYSKRQLWLKSGGTCPFTRQDRIDGRRERHMGSGRFNDGDLF